MNRAGHSRTLRAFLLIVVLGYGGYPALAQIPMPTRTVLPSRDTTTEFFTALKAASGDAAHGLATFPTHPTVEERRSLEALGVRVLTPLLGTTYRVRVEKRTDSRALARSKLRPNLVRLNAQDRVHPDLWREEFSKYVVKPPRRKSQNYVLNADGTLRLSVRIHAGVPETEATQALRRHAQFLHREGGQTWVAVVPRASLRALAGEDVVQWIGAGPLPFLPENDLMRSAINVNSVQNFDNTTGKVLGLGGKGVQVGVFDKGVDQSHDDFDGDFDADSDGVLDSRVIRDDAGAESHATHLAGIIAGNGKRSAGVDSIGSSNCEGPCKAYRWRGMAPLAEIIDIDQMPPFGQNGKKPETHYLYISTEGMDLSNHSYAFSFDGAYDESNQARDQIIRGDAPASDGSRVPARLHVTSAGNSGQAASFGSQQKGYFSLTKEVKNALVVGSWDHAVDRIANASSLGPAHDGRIKPDVVAPGGNIRSTGICSMDEAELPEAEWPAFCKDASGHFVQRQNFYRVMRGTSMASAAATGALALVLEQFATTYGVELDLNHPAPSTLRAVMIHTARDKHSSTPTSNPDCPASNLNCVVDTLGPDFVTGWGLIDAQAAVSTVASRLLLEDSVTTTCDSITHLFTVPPGTAGPVRVTLAWDDLASDAMPTAMAATAPTLRNDLDLVLIDPNGTEHYPWQLDQEILDTAGNTISNAMQVCGTGITVSRQFKPVTNPSEFVNDTIPGGVVPKAVRGGRDHLNNVEVVDVEAAAVVAGTWQARVTGFAIIEGPQRFSLVGNSFRVAHIGPIATCDRFPVLCKEAAIRVDLCKRYPKLCEPRIAFPAPGRIRIGFDDPRQKIALPLDRICQYAVNCPGCGSNTLCPGYELQVESATAPLRVEVYSAKGRLMRRDASTKRDKRLAFQSRPGEQYFIVFSPLPGTPPRTELEVGLRLN